MTFYTNVVSNDFDDVWCYFHLGATKSDILTNTTGAHQSTKSSNFIMFENAILKENSDSFKLLRTFNKNI